MSSRDKKMEQRLSAAGASLLQIPLLHDELLALLDQAEELLQKVEQSPSRSMQTALSPLMKALVVEELLKHSDVDVKAGIACCISEITRIMAPDTPYDEDIMKDVFQLIVSSFENLSDMSSRSYDKRTTILETMAKVRSCVVMLDLERDQMIIEMFRHFLKAIRVNHPEVVFQSMKTIMTVVLEESEDICPDLLIPILDTLKMNNEDVMPIARKLAESVIQSSAYRVRPYLTQTVRKLGADLDDFGKVVASVCRGKTNIVSVSRDQSVAKDGREETNLQKIGSTLIGSESVVSNGIIEAVSGEIMTDANPRKADSNNQVFATSVFKADSDDCSAQNQVKLEAKAGNSEAREVACNHEIASKDVPVSPTKAKPVKAAESLDKVKDTISQLSPSQAPENESPSKKYSSVKEENLDREETLSVDTASKKASGGESVPKSKLAKKGKKRSGETTVKDQASIEVGESKNDEGSTSDSEARSLNQAKDLGDAVSKKAFERDTISKSKKLPQKGKKRSDEKTDKDQASTEKGATKNDDRSTSDSKARTLNQTEKLDAPKKASEGESRTKAKKQWQKGTEQSDKTIDEDQTLTKEGASKKKHLRDAASKKASEGESISKAKKQRRKRKMQSDEITDKGKVFTDEGASKNDKGGTSNSEERSRDKMEKLEDSTSKKVSERESISVVKKPQRRGRKRSVRTTDEDRELTEEGASKNNEINKSDSKARSLDQMEKLGGGSNKMENVSSMTKEDVKIGGLLKSTSGKDALKSFATEVHMKDQMTSPRSPLKSLKDEDTQEETPRMSSKRKRTPGTMKESNTIKYDKSLVGSKVKVWRPRDETFYEGVIASFDHVKRKHKVYYVDGDVEDINLSLERWEFVGDVSVKNGDAEVEHSSPDTSYDAQRKKKKEGNINSESSKSSKLQMNNCALHSCIKPLILGCESVGDSRKASAGMSKGDGKPESEIKVNNTELIGNYVDDAAIKPQELGDKSQGDSAKTPSHPTKLDSQSTLRRFSRMLSEDIHSDVTIITSDGSLKAHKSILSASSLVFNSMFLREEVSTVEMKETTSESCMALLRFLYGSPNKEAFLRHRLDLLGAASKYEIVDLKDACEESLLEDMNSGNVVERLQQAWVYKLDKLKKECSTYLMDSEKINDVGEVMDELFRQADRGMLVEMFQVVLAVWKRS